MARAHVEQPQSGRCKKYYICKQIITVKSRCLGLVTTKGAVFPTVTQCVFLQVAWKCIHDFYTAKWWTFDVMYVLFGIFLGIMTLLCASIGFCVVTMY